ncbi:hypothetical protein [Sorangium sp. So ce145]|uniref:hypothetical protein n=1 Tax=Sorangium sp. So ce145 TaxID=3133285 RepID=UPI003F646CCE
MKDMSQLMRFRTAYLRAIAGAWSDPELLEQLTTSPYASEAGTGNTITVLREYGFDWERSPWNNVCQIQIVSGTRLEWTGDEWIWPRPAPSSPRNTPPTALPPIDSLTLWLPLSAPSSTGSTTSGDHPIQARALTEFYMQHANLFSDDWGNWCIKPADEAVAPLQVDPGDATSFYGEVCISSPTISGKLMPDDADFTAFKVALLGAMAKAWTNPSFKEMLQTNATQALQTIRRYRMPWKMGLYIQEDKGAKWDGASNWKAPAGGRGNGVGNSDTTSDEGLGAGSKNPKNMNGPWESSRRHMLTLCLPQPPDNSSDEPLALAAYNAAGAQYPFSCCS